MAERWVKVARVGDVGPEAPFAVTLEGVDLLLHAAGGRLACTGSICPHQGRSLRTGRYEAGLLICPWHAWTFDVATGVSPFTPRACIPSYPVRVEGVDVYLGVASPVGDSPGASG